MTETLAIIGVASFVIFIVSALVAYFSESNAALWLFVIFMIVFFVAVIGMTVSDAGDAEKVYNNGIHAEDGGHWDLVSSSRWRGFSEYVYECDECGKTLSSPVLLDEVEK